MVETRALLLPAKGLIIKKFLVNWPSKGLGFVIGGPLTLKCSKSQSPHVKKCNPRNLTSWACMVSLKVLASILMFKGQGLEKASPQNSKIYG